MAKYRIEKDHFVDSTTGKKSRTVSLITGNADKDWLKKQDASIENYEETHERGNIPERVRHLYSMFNGYVLSMILSHIGPSDRGTIRILDVGCGISTTVPVYIGRIPEQYVYVGLDPIEKNPERNYLFMNAMIEDVGDSLEEDSKFDVFLFSTSLDHFSDLEAAAKSVRKAAAKGAIAIFWNGLHDPYSLAQLYGMDIVKLIFSKITPAHFYRKLAGASLVRFPKLFKTFRKLDHDLNSGIPLDNVHSYYFTRQNVRQHCETFGKIIDFCDLSPDVFITCKTGKE